MASDDMEVKEVRLPDTIRRVAPEARAYEVGDCHVVTAMEYGRFHMTISHSRRDPTWEEIKKARDELAPEDAFLVIPMPPRRFWLSYHTHCWHLWEMDDDVLRREFIGSGGGDEKDAARYEKEKMLFHAPPDRGVMTDDEWLEWVEDELRRGGLDYAADLLRKNARKK